MNENLNLVEILKDCPKGTKLYCTVYGEVKLHRVDYELEYPISVKNKEKGIAWLSSDGRLSRKLDGECLLFPSKDQRDWSKFTAPWYKKDRFDPKTLTAFDKVLVRRGNENYNVWFPDFVSDPPNNDNNKTLCMCVGDDIAMVIPYNDDTKHLISTTDEAPEFYKYWED